MKKVHLRRIFLFCSLVFAFLYFIIAAKPLGKQIALKVEWTKSFPLILSSAPEKELNLKIHRPIKFQLGNVFGYFEENGDIIFMATSSNSIETSNNSIASSNKDNSDFSTMSSNNYLSISEDAWSLYDKRLSNIDLKNSKASTLFTLNKEGYPFIIGDRFFLMSEDQTSIKEVSNNGKLLWSWSFNAIITAFAASKELAVFGLLDGEVIGFNNKGMKVLDLNPGANPKISRISCVYGLSVSPNSENVAIIFGIDKQRIAVLTKKGSRYAQTGNFISETDIRRPIAVSWSNSENSINGIRKNSENSIIEYESEVGIKLLDINKGTIVSMPNITKESIGRALLDGDIIVLIKNTIEGKTLLFFTKNFNSVFSIDLGKNNIFFSIRDNKMFLSNDFILSRIDLIKI